jgi:peptidoglycan/xylan/chitin deacetylase (PgdA/CDA1 family)
MGASHNPVILTYHSISDGDSPLKISPKLFAEQLEWLRDNARVVSLDEIVSVLANHRPLPEQTVALTFDDGFQDFYTSAAPLLHGWGLPATVFLATGYCGRTNAWPGQPDRVEREPLLTWEHVEELARQGFSFGAHSVSHPVLTRLPVALAQQEIIQCKAQIEERVGQPVEYFCYPYGYWNPVVRNLVNQHYKGACTTIARAIDPGSDPFTLPRADVHYLRHKRLFRMLFTGRFLAYLTTRRLIRRVRREPEGGSYAHS